MPTENVVTVGHTKKCTQCTQCKSLLPTLGNEQYHRLVYAGLMHVFKISYFFPANVYMYLSTHVYVYCVIISAFK